MALTDSQIVAAEAKIPQEGYFHRVLVAFDQFVNVLTGGRPDETISARSYRWSQMTTGFALWRWLGKFMNTWLGWLQSNHGEKAAAGDLERSEIVEQVEDKELGQNL